jgi:hypothetical protein
MGGREEEASRGWVGGIYSMPLGRIVLYRSAHYYYEKSRSLPTKFSIFLGISRNCHDWNISFNAFSRGESSFKESIKSYQRLLSAKMTNRSR